MPSRQARLPYGETSTLQGISENFAFHASPELFIAQRVRQFQQSNPDLANSHAIVRAKILNRNVAIVTSHSHILQILSQSSSEDGQEPAFVASTAYDELMGPFFPAPNLLLTDGEAHARRREPWEARMADMSAKSKSFIEKTTKAHFDSLVRATDKTDLYVSMKELAWKILLGVFLDLVPGDEEFDRIESLQEDLLRGQFSLFPVSINVGFWKSPRRIGIDAKEKLQKVILRRLQQVCPFSVDGEDKLKEVADHVLLFTSSLAAKALASLLTALFLNLYLFPLDEANTGCLSLMSSNNKNVLRNLILETERLSPPIVGILRRATREFIVESKGSSIDTLIPQGWEAWIYFVGGGRDPEAFGEDVNIFNPERYTNAQTPAPFAFGAGPKSCLGKSFMRDTLHLVAKICIDSGTRMTAESIETDGVRAWLGWDASCSPEKWAADMKQLPTQHPREPILVKFHSS